MNWWKLEQAQSTRTNSLLKTIKMDSYTGAESDVSLKIQIILAQGE